MSNRMQLSDPADLFARAKGGDMEAVGELFARYQDQLLAIVRYRMGKRLRTQCESRDVLQSAVIEVLRSLPKFNWQSEPAFLHWLGKAIHHKILKLARRAGAHRRGQGQTLSMDADPELRVQIEEVMTRLPSPSSYLRIREDVDLLNRGIETLTARERRAVVMRWCEGLSYPEIAAETGTSPDAARMLVARTVEKLEAFYRHVSNRDVQE